MCFFLEIEHFPDYNRIFKSVVKNLIEDTRCEVHRTVLGVREGKDGWFEMFCLNGIVCDDGEMFSLMVKNFLIQQKIFFCSCFVFLAQ